MTPRYRLEYEAEDLRQRHPPHIYHPLKKLVLARCGAPWSGHVTVSRWGERPLLASAARPTEIQVRLGHYDYAEPGPTVWHVNFADPRLFIAYGSGLLAQDELQVLEHPALASVREALFAENMIARTEHGGTPTPVLVSNVQRRCVLDTTPDLGRPHGLYGNRFAEATEAQVLDALTILDPAPFSNIVAMAAPAGGRGAYSRAEVVHVIDTAVTAFGAVVFESGPTSEVRTGFWGCGAFGGNRHMMVALQAYAAELVGVRRLVFYSYDRDGMDDVHAGLALLASCRGPTEDATVDAIVSRRLEWGIGDGT